MQQSVAGVICCSTPYGLVCSAGTTVVLSTVALKNTLCGAVLCCALLGQPVLCGTIDAL
jgi:hypothetical protein